MYKGLALIDSECLRQVTKIMPKKKKRKKVKWLSKEALQKAEKRREAKGKGERERYTHLNAEFSKNSKER